jgi:hypothetical protein
MMSSVLPNEGNPLTKENVMEDIVRVLTLAGLLLQLVAVVIELLD